MFVDESRAASDPILAAVGVLQFDVLLFRLKNEYNVECSLENLSFKYARWTNASIDDIAKAKEQTDVVTVRDMQGCYLFLFKNDFSLSYFQEKCPYITLFSSNSSLHGNMMDMATSVFEP